MRKLCVVLALLGGCVFADDPDNSSGHYCGDRSVDAPFETCDDGNAVSGDGCSATCQTEMEPLDTFITASWNLRTTSGTTLACPTGFDTAALYSQPVSSTGVPVGTPYIDLYDCAAKTGMTAPLPGGTYLVWVEITNTNNTQVYAKSLSAAVDTTTGDQAVSFSIYSDGGFFQVAWTLVGATSNAALTCAQAGATGGIEVRASDAANASNTNTDFFTCEQGSAVTDPFAQATYTVSIQAIDSNDATVGAAPDLTNKQIQGPNLVTDLGTVNIPITGH
jgi:cysteine-rich repeat protein